jgi:uncharacterized protein (TIGR02246 family)
VRNNGVVHQGEPKSRIVTASHVNDCLSKELTLMIRTSRVFAMAAAGVFVTLGASVCRADDEADIRKTVDAYVAAFNAGDAAAVAAHWAEDGEFVTPAGEKLQGKQAIREAFEAFLKENQGAKVEVKIASIRVADDGAAVEQGTARVTRPGEDPTETTYVATYRKRDGKWRLRTTSSSRSWSG